MQDPLTWSIFFAFYAPLHFMGPTLVGLLTGAEDRRQRRTLLRGIVIDCSVSLLIAFGAALLLVRSDPQLAMLLVLLAVLAPYSYIWLHRRRRAVPWFEDDGFG
jgi:hypothetical protein